MVRHVGKVIDGRGGEAAEEGDWVCRQSVYGRERASDSRAAKTAKGLIKSVKGRCECVWRDDIRCDFVEFAHPREELAIGMSRLVVGHAAEGLDSPT